MEQKTFSVTCFDLAKITKVKWCRKGFIKQTSGIDQF